MACFAHLVLFFIMLFSTVPDIDATASVSVRLVKYDTNWPTCGFFDGLCDPGFEICLNGNCVKTNNSDNTNHIDFNEITITPNPAVFNFNYSESPLSVNVSVFDVTLVIEPRLLTAMGTTIDVPGFCNSSWFSITLTGPHNTRLQIEVDVISNCSSVYGRSETTAPTDVLKLNTTYPSFNHRESTVWEQGSSEYDTSATTDPTNAFTLNTTDPWNTHRETTVWMQETTGAPIDIEFNVTKDN